MLRAEDNKFLTESGAGTGMMAPIRKEKPRGQLRREGLLTDGARSRFRLSLTNL